MELDEFSLLFALQSVQTHLLQFELYVILKTMRFCMKCLKTTVF